MLLCNIYWLIFLEILKINLAVGLNLCGNSYIQAYMPYNSYIFSQLNKILAIYCTQNIVLIFDQLTLELIF